ncbi:kinase-like domain-containing protein [Colletotrichum cereale]|nr:kinase-like domain-containing protein [Colletotrichum cereale]
MATSMDYGFLDVVPMSTSPATIGSRTSKPLFFSIDQVLKGRKSTYTIGKELHRAVDEAAVYLARGQNKSKCIVKSVRGHWRLQNEANALRRYQSKTPHLDSELLTESNRKRLTRPEIKPVASCILKALLVLHEDGMVHTVSIDSGFAREGHVIGAVFVRSPVAMLQLSWGTSTDVWSFGNAILSLVHRGGYHHFDPGWEGIKPEDEDYEITVMKRMPLQRWTTKEIPSADNKFIRRILKLDPQDRPTVEEILEDEWFTEESEGTREPIPERNCLVQS